MNKFFVLTMKNTSSYWIAFKIKFNIEKLTLKIEKRDCSPFFVTLVESISKYKCGIQSVLQKRRYSGAMFSSKFNVVPWLKKSL